MPLARYFFFVGGVLLALLFISDAYSPKMPDAVRADATRADEDAPMLRVHTDRKWPERIVFDTNRNVTTVQIADAGVAPEAGADVSAKVREAFAQQQPPDSKQLQSVDSRKIEPKPQPKRKIAKRHVAPPTGLVAQQPQIGLFANNTW